MDFFLGAKNSEARMLGFSGYAKIEQEEIVNA
jgi:hypothetical protein